MTRFHRALLRATPPALALALLAGCAGAPSTVEWSAVPAADQHRFLPQLVHDEMRPLAIVTAGPDGLVVKSDRAPFAHMVAQEGQVRLVSRETYARMQRDGDTGAMGAPSAPSR